MIFLGGYIDFGIQELWTHLFFCLAAAEFRSYSAVGSCFGRNFQLPTEGYDVMDCQAAEAIE